MSDAQHKLGRLLTGTEGRDAVHIAIAPVVAGEPISPGDDIGFLREGDTETVAPHGPQEFIGIADPFLQHPVRTGERFWMFLYPNTVTGLRHVYSHPAFPEEVGASDLLPTKAESEEWLRAFCETHNCPRYETLIAGALAVDIPREKWEWGHLYNDGDSLYSYGGEAGGEIPDEFWLHVQIVTGKRVPKEKQASWFSCSC